MNREGMEKHAAPEAIAASIDERNKRVKRINDDLMWLSDLMRRRLRQIERGEWPARLEAEDE